MAAPTPWTSEAGRPPRVDFARLDCPLKQECLVCRVTLECERTVCKESGDSGCKSQVPDRTQE